MKFKVVIMKKTTQKETFSMDLKKFCELNNISRRTALNWIKSGKLQTENKFSQGKIQYSAHYSYKREKRFLCVFQ